MRCRSETTAAARGHRLTLPLRAAPAARAARADRALGAAAATATATAAALRLPARDAGVAAVLGLLRKAAAHGVEDAARQRQERFTGEVELSDAGELLHASPP